MAQHTADNSPFPPVIELLTIDSTNNYALGLLRQEGAGQQQKTIGHGSGVFAHEQLAGKGQRGRVWLSNGGENIHLSVVIDPRQIGTKEPFLLVVMTALAVRAFFDHYAQSDITIKWPNDIYFRNRKAGGILIENIMSGNNWKWAVVGIGLNINQVVFADEIQDKAVSLRQITGKQFNCLALATELRDAVMQQSALHPEANNLIAVYNQFLFKKDQKVTLEKQGRPVEVIIKKVLPTGELVVQADTGELRFQFGEVKWLL